MLALGKKFFNIVTPYHRIFINIILPDNEVIVLPAINTAVFFLGKDDCIMLDSLDNLDELVWLDYTLLDPKTGEKKFIENFQDFKRVVKKCLAKGTLATFTIIGKQIFGKNCNILAHIFNPETGKIEE